MLSSFNPNIPVSALLDKPVTLSFWQGDNAVRYVNGIVTRFGVGETGFLRTQYNMVVEPALIRASYQSDSRIFQHQNSEKSSARYYTKMGLKMWHLNPCRQIGCGNIACNIVKRIWPLLSVWRQKRAGIIILSTKPAATDCTLGTGVCLPQFLAH